MGGHNKLKEITRKKLEKGMEIEQIAKNLEEDTETIRSIYDEILRENEQEKKHNYL